MTDTNVAQSDINRQRIVPSNYTMIPNVVFDFWMAELSPMEFKILMCIGRKTFGWGQFYDQISLAQIVKMSGVSRKGVRMAIDKLESHKLVKRTRNMADDGSCEATTYEIIVVDEGPIYKKRLPRELSTSGRGLSNPPPRVLSNPPPKGCKVLKKEEKENKNHHQTSSKTKIEPRDRVVVFPFLERIPDLPKNLAEKLMEDYTEAELEAAAGMLHGADEYIAKPFAWIRRCIEEGWDEAPNEKERIDANRRILKDSFWGMEGRKYGPYRASVGENYVEFVAGGNAKTVVFEVTDRGFESRVRDFARNAQDSF